MTLRKAVFTITADSQAQPVNNPTRVSQGKADVSLRPSIGNRTARVETVLVDVSAAVSKDVDVTISELLPAEDTIVASDTTTETYTLGRQLFYADLQTPVPAGQVAPYGDVYEFDARHAVVSTIGGVAPSTDQLGAREHIRTDAVRAECYKMAPGDVVTVTMYYETAGDYRF